MFKAQKIKARNKKLPVLAMILYSICLIISLTTFYN